MKKVCLCILLSAILILGVLPVGAASDLVKDGATISAIDSGISLMEAISGMSAGTYYLNSDCCELFLRRVSSTATASVVKYYSGGAIKWKFEELSEGTFLIRSALSSSYALYGSGTSVTLPEAPTDNAMITDSGFKWRVYTAVGGGVLLENVGTQTYLRCDGTTVSLAEKPASTSTEYVHLVWRIPLVSNYVNLESFTLSYSSTTLRIGDSLAATVTVTPSNATWKSLYNFSWSSSNTAVAIVSSTGRITGVSVGTATITAIHKATGEEANVTVTVSELPIDGTYCITLYDLDQTMTVSNGGAWLYPFCSMDTDSWILTHRTGTYYTIQSIYDNSALTVSGGSVVLQAYQVGNTAQYWSIQRLATGRCNIVSYSGQYLCYGTGTDPLPITIGSNDDEWTLVQPYDASLIALPDDNDRSSYFGNIAAHLAEMNYPNVYNNHPYRAYNVSRDELLCYMANSKITLIRTHGNTGSVQVSESISLTKEYLQDLDDEFLFENSELIIYAACLTGEGGATADNLVKATHDSGARSVIGFQNVTNTYATNEWSEKFFEKLSYYSQNPSLQKSLTDICSELNDESANFVYAQNYHYIYGDTLVSLRNYVVAGSTDLPGSN